MAKIATIPYLVTNAALINEFLVGLISALNRKTFDWAKGK